MHLARNFNTTSRKLTQQIAPIVQEKWAKHEKTDKRFMGSYNTASYETKPRFSLAFSNGFIILLGLVARSYVTGDTRMAHFVTGMSFRTGAAALSPAETWFTIGVGRSCCSCWFGSGVRQTRFLLIMPVGVSTLYDRGVDAASMTFPNRRRSLKKTWVPSRSNWRQGLGFVPGVEHCFPPQFAHALSCTQVIQVRALWAQLGVE